MQAHQSRYCSGIKKTEEMRFLEALLLKAGGSGHSNPPGLSPTDMVALLAARHTAEAAAAGPPTSSEAAAAPPPTRVKSEVGLNSPPPPTGGHKSPSPAASISPRGGLSNSETSGGGEDFCCILCGLKEASVDKLKDHINMHFIGRLFVCYFFYQKQHL
jgi:hypothetical protein